ncbi:DUF3152 domain-containing protein [Streptomyces sp. NPDC012751]|uniref:DUF3152 domain-containing protein n=1 Tax=Streptomyces sp. NPDC012751 TaxID=3364846 RepID=UPI0036B5C84B
MSGPPDGARGRGGAGSPAPGAERPGRTPEPGTSERSGNAPASGASGLSGGTPAHGTPGTAGGAPGRGAPGSADGAPARGVPRAARGAAARGGHPEQWEPGGGWGEFGGRTADAGDPGVVLPRQRRAGSGGRGRGSGSGPRQEYLDAFDGAGGGSRDARAAHDAREGGGSAAGTAPARRAGGQPPEAPRPAATAADGAGLPGQRGGTKGWAFTGIAAAAVTTVLAVVVAGQVSEGRDDAGASSRSAADQAGGSLASGGPTPSATPSTVPLTYDQKMGTKYPLGAGLTGPGKFDAVPGFDKAPGTGQKYRYRVDIEQGLGLDGALFAEAVQLTLNDERSWAHGGARTFERVSSGKPDFVITLASPGTTAKWCAKSGLDTTEDNVSCDSAATERVMINAYRWAQGSKTYGDRIHAYRQMLINHEVGHRLGNGHVSCQKDGELAPVMQQQTKFLDHDGIHCRPNPWPYPGS